MLKKYHLLLSLILTSFVFGQIFDNHTSELVVLKTSDYKSYVGQVQKSNTDSINFKTFDGNDIVFSQSDVLMIYDFNGRIRNDRLQREDPNSSFYLFSPSAFSIDNGKLFCRDFCLFFPSLNYGLANILSVQAGLFWYPGMDIENTPFVGNLKVTAFESNIFSIAGGITYINLPVIQKERILSTGFAFVTGTIGDRYNHISLSAGWGYIQREKEWEREDKPILVASGNLRLFNYVSLVNENWFFSNEDVNDALITTALRFFGRQIAVDLGATFTINSIKENEAPIPVLNITYHLN